MFQILKIFHKNGYIFIGMGNLGYFPFIPSSNIVKINAQQGCTKLFLIEKCPKFRNTITNNILQFEENR